MFLCPCLFITFLRSDQGQSIARQNFDKYSIVPTCLIYRYACNTKQFEIHNKKHTNQRLPGACNRSPGSNLLSITTQLHCGGHLGGWVRLPDTILEEDHPMTIPSKFGSNWATGSRQDGFMWISHRVLG